MPSKTAIISGGARGIGRCIARRFLELDYRVFILDIDAEELQHTTTVHLRQYYEQKKVDSAVCNLRSIDEIRAQVKRGAEFLGGRIEVLVNNGGIARPYWADGKTMGDLDTITQWQA